ncbi:hypothetical protein [Nocardia sp. NPDC051463]|uniref:hypothetical protein n=1 Tax=Nocardia sp. NPDC051463 TaxID=3154845 RepID=UPI00342E9E7C
MRRIAVAACFVLGVAAQSAGFGVTIAAAETLAEYCATPGEIDIPEYVNYCCSQYVDNQLPAIPEVQKKWGNRCRR